MGSAFLGLTIPDFSLRNTGGTKIATAIVNGGIEGPRSLERWGRTGCALSRDEARKEGGSNNDRGEGTHLHWLSATGRTTRRGGSREQ